MPQIYLDLPGMDRAAAQNKLYQAEVENLPVRADLMRSQARMGEAHSKLYENQAQEASETLQDRIASYRAKVGEEKWKAIKSQQEILADEAIGHLNQFDYLTKTKKLSPDQAWADVQISIGRDTYPRLKAAGIENLPDPADLTPGDLIQQAGMKKVMADLYGAREAQAKTSAKAKAAGTRGGAATSFVQIHGLVTREFPDMDKEETMALARDIYSEGKYNRKAAAVRLKAAGIRDERITQFLGSLEGEKEIPGQGPAGIPSFD